MSVCVSVSVTKKCHKPQDQFNETCRNDYEHLPLINFLNQCDSRWLPQKHKHGYNSITVTDMNQTFGMVVAKTDP